MTKQYCDRCEEPVDSLEFPKTLYHHSGTRAGYLKEIEMCKKCYESYKRWRNPDKEIIPPAQATGRSK